MITQSPQQLREAADIQEQILALQSELNAILGGEIPIPYRTEGRRKNKMSAAGRAAISAAAKARWAKFNSGKGKTKPGKSARKNKMSAAGRARLAAAVKARWAKAKKAGKSRL